MAGRKSKDKGARFERVVASDLSLWFYGIPGFLRRTPMSGGWSKIHAPGDVCATVSGTVETESGLMVLSIGDSRPVAFPFYVECRNREGWSYTDLFTESEKACLVLWWKEVIEKSREVSLIPLLIFTKNYNPSFIMFQPRTDLGGITCINLSSKMFEGNPVVILFYDFLACVKRECFYGEEESKVSERN